jgi:DNA modification methylase
MLTTATPNKNKLVHDWYMMPEAYSGKLIEDVLKRFGLPKSSTILDPFNGTGTTTVIAKLQGMTGIGVEVNPFLCFAAEMKTHWNYDLPRLRQDIDGLLKRIRPQIVHLRGPQPTLFDEKDDPNTPQIECELPNMPRLFRWICERAVAKVLLIKREIAAIENPAHRQLALLGLAGIIRSVSNMKLTPHAFGGREPKTDAPVYQEFETKVLKIIRDLELLQQRNDYGKVHIIRGDARRIGELLPPRNFVDLDFAVTSPPYLNNLDYTMQTRMELFFLEFVASMNDLKRVREQMVVCDAKGIYKDSNDTQALTGAAREKVVAVANAIGEKLKGRVWGWDYPRMTTEYFGGMARVFQGVHAVLKRGARFVVVVGASSHMGVLVDVPVLLGDVAKEVSFDVEGIEVMRVRRSSSHRHELKECAVILRKP